MPSVSIPVSVRFKADLSIEEFSAALSLALDGNLSGLVGAFSPTCPYLENEKARQHVVLLSSGIVSRADRTEAKAVEGVLSDAVEALESRIGSDDDGEDADANEPVRHSLNPTGRNGDPTVYKLKNLDGRSAKGTQIELRRKLGMGIPKLYQLLNTPGRVTRDGWYLATARAARGAQGGE